MGWLARVPSQDACPSGHRYLRSPWMYDCQQNVYLGGPISLANYNEVPRVTCQRAVSNLEPRRNKIIVTKYPKRKITAGQEVVWSYNLKSAGKSSSNIFHHKEWQLVGVIFMTGVC